MKIGAIGFYTNFNHNNIENIKYSSEQTILEYDMLIINVNNIYEEYEMVGNYGKIYFQKVLPNIKSYVKLKIIVKAKKFKSVYTFL